MNICTFNQQQLPADGPWNTVTTPSRGRYAPGIQQSFIKGKVKGKGRLQGSDNGIVAFHCGPAGQKIIMLIGFLIIMKPYA